MSEAKESSSLADRISQPTSHLDASSKTFTPASSTTADRPTTSSSWADEVASPEVEKPNSLESAQVDGATVPAGGSALQEPEYEVEVKLSDIQGDANSPLYSIQSFEQLGLYVFRVLSSAVPTDFYADRNKF